MKTEHKIVHTTGTELQSVLNDLQAQGYKAIRFVQEPTVCYMVTARKHVPEPSDPEVQETGKVLKLRAVGVSVRKIARQLGLTPSKVQRIITKSRDA